MNWLDTTVTSPLEQVAHLKKQNKEGAKTFIEGIIMSLEKTDYSRFSEDELTEVKQRTLNHINYWKAVKSELLKDEPKKVEPAPQSESPKQEPAARPTFQKTEFQRQGLPKIKPK